jgi:hypothetical protein
MGEQLPIVGAGAALTVLLTVIGLLLRANASDRRDYWGRLEGLREALKKADVDWQVRLDAVNAAWQLRLDAVDAALGRCQEAVDTERKLRRDVEDNTWRQLKENGQELVRLRAEVARLRRTVTGQPDEPDS